MFIILTTYNIFLSQNLPQNAQNSMQKIMNFIHLPSQKCMKFTRQKCACIWQLANLELNLLATCKIGTNCYMWNICKI